MKENIFKCTRSLLLGTFHKGFQNYRDFKYVLNITNIYSYIYLNVKYIFYKFK